MTDAFVGNISRVNVWDYVLPRETIELLSQRCGLEQGETVAWKDFKNGFFNGVAFIREPSSCQGVEEFMRELVMSDHHFNFKPNVGD